MILLLDFIINRSQKLIFLYIKGRNKIIIKINRMTEGYIV